MPYKCLIGLCGYLASGAPNGYIIYLPKCGGHMTEDDTKKYVSELNALSNDDECIVCKEELKLLECTRLFKMPCCKRFICIECSQKMNPWNKCVYCQQNIVINTFKYDIDKDIDITYPVNIFEDRRQSLADINELQNYKDRFERYPEIQDAFDKTIATMISNLTSPMLFDVVYPAFIKEGDIVKGYIKRTSF